MWVRDQSKLILVNTDKFEIKETRYGEKINNLYIVHTVNERNIYCDWNIMSNNICLGTYSTKEKALKILNKIEEVLIDGELIEQVDGHKYRNHKNIVIQMPLDKDGI